MRITMGCICAARCICHMNRDAQALYLDLLHADRHDEAEALRMSGVPAGPATRKDRP